LHAINVKATGPAGTPDLVFVEVFAGRAEITMAVRASGLAAAAFDKDTCDEDDILTPRGYLKAGAGKHVQQGAGT
jgi:hypothetical protein